MENPIFWCSTCLNTSTRPRITFDTHGRCNACQWSEAKTTMDWRPRENELHELLRQSKSNRESQSGFDCIVPVSGGKDGSYVAHQLKAKYGARPLTLTISPELSTEVGERNLANFIKSGFDHIRVSPNPLVMRELNRSGFIEMGFPYFGWLLSIHATVVRIAASFGIGLVFYGEDGEVEYGGSTESLNKAVYDVDYTKRIYLESGYEKVLKSTHVNDELLSMFKFPTDEEIGRVNIRTARWSYFEPWDSYRNYVVAKQHCGLDDLPSGNIGTFTNFSQNDQDLYPLHTYLMYLKFGFGRATQDAGIEVRRGAMSREQAVNLVRLYDNGYPEIFIDSYLEYYKMTKLEFDLVLDRWVNRNLFEKIDGRWMPLFQVR